MIIYTTKTTKRLNYILDLLIRDMLGLDFSLTNDINRLNVKNESIINYSHKHISGSLNITPCNLLFENEVFDKELSPVGHWDDCPVFFETTDGDIPFDIFAASFFLVTRYEEYLPFTPDIHGRFPSSSSYARKQNFHHLPVVNMWVQKFGEKLRKKFPSIPVKPQTFNFLSTIDIDYAWAFLNKPFLRSSLSLLKSILETDFKEFRLKLNVLRKKFPDPYDSYSEWSFLHEGMMKKVMVFLLVSSESHYDMVINPGNKKWKKLIQTLSEGYITGLHPSYGSDNDPGKVLKEKLFLESICGQPVIKSRQHFIRLRMPETYNALIKAGIREDFSMGFHDIIGFRAGIAHPFKFFDLEKNDATELRIYPFSVMERTLKDYLGLNSSQASVEIDGLINRVASCGGLFISIWHNNSLGDYGEWKGWKKTYIRMNELCKKASL